ncbi:hypothetical protein SDC9_180390 [bioreactor metagenome]|uniref:Uncharacterized protein n=1 Tax=bioreactor metagenome TaxID=1076179 RepID=A0A645H1K2_9ZZZZ
MHQPPLIQAIILKPDFAAVNRIQNVLNPRNKQPHDGRFLFRHGLQNPFGGNAPEDYRFASGQQAAEPVHFRAGMVQRRNAQKHVVMRLGMMILLG